jgi:hypothetical protein
MTAKLTAWVAINGKKTTFNVKDANTMKALTNALYGGLNAQFQMGDYQATCTKHASGGSSQLKVEAGSTVDGSEVSRLSLVVSGQDAASIAAFEAHATALMAPFAHHVSP